VKKCVIVAPGANGADSVTLKDTTFSIFWKR